MRCGTVQCIASRGSGLNGIRPRRFLERDFQQIMTLSNDTANIIAKVGPTFSARESDGEEDLKRLNEHPLSIIANLSHGVKTPIASLVGVVFVGR